MSRFEPKSPFYDEYANFRPKNREHDLGPPPTQIFQNFMRNNPRKKNFSKMEKIPGEFLSADLYFFENGRCILKSVFFMVFDGSESIGSGLERLRRV